MFIRAKHLIALLMLTFTAACAIEDDSLPEGSVLDESESIEDVGSDTEAYRKPIKLPVSSCSYYRTEESCGGFGGCVYWYLDVNDDQSVCGDRICQCETT